MLQACLPIGWATQGSGLALSTQEPHVPSLETEKKEEFHFHEHGEQTSAQFRYGVFFLLYLNTDFTDSKGNLPVALLHLLGKITSIAKGMNLNGPK